VRSVDLFVGAGGLAMGVSRAGFRHAAVVELDHDACETIRHNQKLLVEPVADWPLFEQDVRCFDFRPFAGRTDLLSGGPPCQPFSLGGKHRGDRDQRNLFPEVVRAVRELQPKVVVVENVKGLLRPAFAHYFEYILLQLAHPELAPRRDEPWPDHLQRLTRHQSLGGLEGLRYNVTYKVLNAADFGVPQRRERVFITAFRSDLGVDWSFPPATHDHDSLLWDQWVSHVYWERHRIPADERPIPPARYRQRVIDLHGQFEPTTLPWLTVRDALWGLPNPGRNVANATNHIFQPGARSYPGHTGSGLDEPAKTLKAGDHGVPGGENMLRMMDGSLRYFTLREAARLQTFPDEYVFAGSWTESMRQLGNAVPLLLAQRVVEAVYSALQTRPLEASLHEQPGVLQSA
jgi:DNA (cytosine-5)-methyltransferase 1